MNRKKKWSTCLAAGPHVKVLGYFCTQIDNVLLVHDEEIFLKDEARINNQGYVTLTNKEYVRTNGPKKRIAFFISHTVENMKVWDCTLLQEGFDIVGVIATKINVTTPKKGVIFPQISDVMNFAQSFGSNIKIRYIDAD